MANNSLNEYIKKSESDGKSETEIRNNLHQAGWDEKSVNEGFNAISNPASTLPADVPRPTTGYANQWDAFEHFLMFISLYIMSSSFALLLHQFVDKLLLKNPNTSNYIFLGTPTTANYTDFGIKSSLACLIVTFPLFAYFHLDINKRTIKNPMLRGIIIRKELIYLTLIITFLILLVEVISTILNLLNGDVSINFLLHLIITVSVSGTIFIIYLHQVKEDRKAHA